MQVQASPEDVGVGLLRLGGNNIATGTPTPWKDVRSTMDFTNADCFKTVRTCFFPRCSEPNTGTKTMPETFLDGTPRGD